jgi:signal peptidase I
MAYQVTGFQHYTVPTNSMAPTIKAGDHVRVEQGGQLSKPERGEIWIFRMPGTPATQVIKRVIGLPGDVVEVANGQVIVNGRVLVEPYLTARPTYVTAQRTLRKDEYFMLGDNRNVSNDSHIWGPLKRKYLMGRVRMRVWPPNRMHNF